MKFLKTLLSRFAIISLLIILQIIMFVTIATLLTEQYIYVAIIMGILSAFALLSIINSDANPDFKVPWITVILLLFPIGLVIYWMFGKGYVSRKHRKLYKETYDREIKFADENKKVEDNLELSAGETYLNQSKYIYNTSVTSIHEHTKVKYYPNGETYFDDLFADLKKAKHFIFMEYFILDHGKVLDELIEILKQKVSEGVDVRIMYDDFGCITKLERKFDSYLRSLGIKCIKFNKYYPVVSVVYNNRDHRKIAVIDGYIGYTGGINLADEYGNYIERFGYWKDTGVRLYGEAVKNFTLMFLNTYDIYSGEKSKISRYLPHVYHEDEFESDGFIQPFGDGPAPVYSHYIGETVYLNMINQATKYVYITTPYLIVDHMLMNALESASKRGVDVRIITPGIPDKKIVYTLTRDSYRPLIKAGVKIYEYTPGFIHAKNVIVDDTAAVVGTINFDYRSLVHHFECGCYMVNTSIIKDIKEDFLNTQSVSKEPLEKVYIHKNIIKRIYISVLKFFAPLL